MIDRDEILHLRACASLLEDAPAADIVLKLTDALLAVMAERDAYQELTVSLMNRSCVMSSDSRSDLIANLRGQADKLEGLSRDEVAQKALDEAVVFRDDYDWESENRDVLEAVKRRIHGDEVESA